jgi:hypothetical protein
LALWLASAALCSCGGVGTLRPEDAPAPRDFYAQIRPAEEPRCQRELRLFHASQSVPAHQVVSTLSVTCSPGALPVCERRLLARACELEADALILDESSRPAGVPPGASSQSLVSRTGRAIRFR